MTQVVKKYKLENIDASKTFDSVEDFFNHSSSVEVDSAKLNAHIENDNANSTGKEGILGEDKKHVIILREFANVEAYNTWHAKRKELGDIDDLIKETDIPMHQNNIEF
tara:strand:- start:1280 stop:1603 length:324 start_codon:yes stop_codon:yes gene_type:complete